MSIKVVLVGGGNMGHAMLTGWTGSGRLQPGEIVLVEPDAELRKRAAADGVTVHGDAAELADGLTPLLVVFAVKPQVIREVAAAYRRFAGQATYVSIAAGTGIAALQQVLGADAAIVRCMPNTPASIGKGMLVVVSNSNVKPEADQFVDELLSASGAVSRIDDEALMDAVTAVSGSGPAYVFHFIECLTAAGEAAGLPAETAELLAMQTVYGAACLAKDSGEEPGNLREQVTSPNGTTAAALGVLMREDALKKLVSEAVEAARARSVELGK